MRHVGTATAIRTVTAIAIIATVLLLGLLAFWAFYPYDPITVTPQPYPIIYPANRVVKQGGLIVYKFHYVKRVAIIPDVHREFVDDISYVSTDPSVNQVAVTTPGEGNTEKEINIPPELPAGVYQLKTDSYYHVNPIRTIHIQSITETFTVEASGDTDVDPKK